MRKSELSLSSIVAPSSTHTTVRVLQYEGKVQVESPRDWKLWIALDAWK